MDVEDVGRYRVTRRIAQGGMAEVFEGVALGSEGFQRRVAIKRMRAENAADPAFGRMFLDEARIASSLHHANIVGVIDFGVAGGYPFQVLEFVDGADLARLMAMGQEAGAPLPPALALAICTDIAHALDHAHQAVDEQGRPLGIVHRDVSPANILVSWNGDVKLSDFGIAFARGRMETTSAGFTKGTLLYMAPEQIMRGEIDGRSDVFALGCVLHAMLAGRSPLAGENAMADLIAGKPLPVSPQLPDDIFDIVTRATRLAKADRFADAGEMAAALGTALARRIDRDARTLMHEWLARLRPQAPVATAGKLDALLGANLVFDGLRKSLPPGEVQANLPPRLPSRQSHDELSLDRPARRARWPLVMGGAALLGVAVAIVAVAGSRTSAPTITPTITPTTTPTPTITPTITPTATTTSPSPTTSTPTSTPTITPTTTSPTITTPTTTSPARVPVEPRRPPPVRPAPVVEAPAAPARGMVAVGGAGALRAEILVDGRSRGFAPRALSLPVGEHSIVLVRPDGTRLGPHQVEVQESHTPSAPLRWVVP